MTAYAAFLAAVALATAPAGKNDANSSLSLAKTIVELSHRRVLVRDTYAKELRAAMPYCKGDAKCQADLDRAIVNAATGVAEQYAASVTQLLSRKLTRQQLQAVLKFYNSPDGRAILEVQSSMSDEMARIGLSSMTYAQQSIAREFCPAHPEICSGRKPQAGGKS